MQSPLQMIRAAAGKKPSVSTTELGQTGSKFGQGTIAGFGSGVLLEQDYNPDLHGTKLYDEIDKMRLGDSLVKGLLRAVKLPLLSADWYFEPGDDSDEQKQMAEWFDNQLMKEMNWTWKTVLRHILLHLDYGVMPFEPVFDIQDDPIYNRPMAYLRKLAPRMPHTVSEWVVDEHGGLAGIVQQAYTLGTISTIPIPIENLLVFIHELEGSNYRGISLLRQARKDWYYKDRFQKLGAIIMEKRGAGVDVGKLTNGDPDKKRAAERVLMDVRTHERAFVLETEDFDYRIEGGGGGKVLDPLPWVNYYDLSMLRGVMAEWLAMDSGAYAVHTDKTSLFLMGLKSVGEDIIETINRHLIPRWADMNFPGLKVYPTLCHAPLDRRDAEKVINAINQLVPRKVITVDPDLENWVRELLDMPEYEAPETPTTPPEPEPSGDMLPPEDLLPPTDAAVRAGGEGSGWSAEGGHVPGSQGGKVPSGKSSGAKSTVETYHETLSSSQKAALSVYQTSEDNQFNEHVRMGRLSDSEEATQREMDSAIHGAPPLGHDSVYRGIAVSRPPAVGTTIEEPGYMSTSLDEGIAIDFAEGNAEFYGGKAYVMEVVGTSKVRALRMPKIPGTADEQEVLFGRGTKLKVQSVTKPSASTGGVGRLVAEYVH